MTGMFVAWSSPVSAEQDAAFNDWYENVHMPQVCEAVGTVTQVRRFTVLGSGQDGGVKRYFAVYDLADADVAKAAAAIRAAGAGGAFDMSPAMAPGSPGDIQFLEPFTWKAGSRQ